MSHVTEDLKKASELPDGDVVRILLQQHAGIRQLCATVGNSEGPAKRQAFDDRRVLLTVHETAEEERVEFPLLLTTIDETSRHMMGKRLNATELVAPTHPHPGSAGSVPKQLATMPFHSIVDRVKAMYRACRDDALRS
ncbi:hypothetical protein OG801_25380 [Nocardioides sp. NBC_00163]|uniref:hypothetical protein n=1 Tax=Nocardioides sp. NBC_00163 TaxID=2975999 RepID=UPI003243A911